LFKIDFFFIIIRDIPHNEVTIVFRKGLSFTDKFNEKNPDEAIRISGDGRWISA
jgi:hypothetical protein